MTAPTPKAGFGNTSYSASTTDIYLGTHDVADGDTIIGYIMWHGSSALPELIRESGTPNYSKTIYVSDPVKHGTQNMWGCDVIIPNLVEDEEMNLFLRLGQDTGGREMWGAFMHPVADLRISSNPFVDFR